MKQQPVGGVEQPEFLNMVWKLTPLYPRKACYRYAGSGKGFTGYGMCAGVPEPWIWIVII